MKYFCDTFPVQRFWKNDEILPTMYFGSKGSMNECSLVLSMILGRKNCSCSFYGISNGFPFLKKVVRFLLLFLFLKSLHPAIFQPFQCFRCKFMVEITKISQCNAVAPNQ
jgi:hypothetical protein